MCYALAAKKERQRQCLEEHDRLSNLFVSNRFAFELERKRLIQSTIDSNENRERLQKQQNEWDKILNGIGSAENRFAMIQSLFWHDFVNNWQPGLEEAVSDLNTIILRIGSRKKLFLVK